MATKQTEKRDSTRLKRIEDSLSNLKAMLLRMAELEQRRWQQMQDWMKELLDTVAEQTKVVDGTKAAFESLAKQLEEELNKPNEEIDLSAIRAIKDEIAMNTQKIGDAVKLGTVAENEDKDGDGFPDAVTGDKLKTDYPDEPKPE